MYLWLNILTLVCAIGGIIISVISIFLHLKNYRKPMDQRLIVRIQLLLPLYALSSLLSLHGSALGSILVPLREIYEAFVIYTFFTLLTNLLGGERDIIISTSGREPKAHLWPLTRIFDRVDISDPYTFLTIKRGILQYTWIKPILALVSALLSRTNSFKNHVVALASPYLWVGLIYNLSITISLYSLALFWHCLWSDLAPYRPLPKFLCIKIIIFFSYWQGVVLGIGVYLGYISDSGKGLTAQSIQDSLMCIEMLGFAIGHWYAFSYQDYSTTEMIGFARLPVYYALRDAVGITDLIFDFKSTFLGDSYGYRQFDSVEALLDHPLSKSREARIRAGLRYQNGGRSKYWLPKSSRNKRSIITPTANYSSISEAPSEEIPPTLEEDQDKIEFERNLETDESLYYQARKLPYGDYNYPVITVRESIPPYTPLINDRRRTIETGLQQEYESFDSL